MHMPGVHHRLVPLLFRTHQTMSVCNPQCWAKQKQHGGSDPPGSFPGTSVRQWLANAPMHVCGVLAYSAAGPHRTYWHRWYRRQALHAIVAKHPPPSLWFVMVCWANSDHPLAIRECPGHWTRGGGAVWRALSSRLLESEGEASFGCMHT